MRNIICIGGSSGALEALERLVRHIPANLPAALFVVRHIAPENSKLLPKILQPHCALPIDEPHDGEEFKMGRVYVAPANRHLVVERKVIRLVNGPKENWARPAIDPLFRTAAQHHGPLAIGIILSGKLDDGTAGLWALKRRGGLAVVQNPSDAAAPEMPTHALAAVDVDAVADAEEIGAMLPQWCRQSSSYKTDDLVNRVIGVENAYLLQQATNDHGLDEVGESSGIVCPDCGGQLWRMGQGPLRYRCHVGHAMSAHTLLAQQREAVEAASWAVIRAIEEDSRIAEDVLHQKLSSEERDVVAGRLARNQAKIERLRPLLFDDLAEAAPVQEVNVGVHAEDPPIGGDHTDPSPVPRT
jgi:two-component system, chemotaxis family, protein-glutamate methylesterase/glutaminase